MTIYGWDMSHYDAPDGTRAVNEGFSFMTHKAGGDANDSELASWWKYMKPYRSRILLGAYWVLYPGSPTARADAFLARLDSQCPGWRDGPWILQVDCEIWGGKASTKPGLADIKAFCGRLAAKMPKLRPIVYAPKWAYGDSLKGLGYPLWGSSYVSGSGAASALYPGDSSSRWGAYSGQTPAILQYSSSATIGGQSTCDANAFKGTLADLTKLLAPGWAAPIEEEDVDLKDKIGSKAYADRDFQDFVLDLHGLRDVLKGDPAGAKVAAYAATSPLMQLLKAPAQLTALTAAVAALAGKDFVDEPAVIAGVLAGLTPERLGAAITAAGFTPAALAAAIPPEIAQDTADALLDQIAAAR